MPLAGRQLTIGWGLALGYHVGFRGAKLTTAVAVMTAESGRYVEAYHDNTNGSQDRGLFQINSIHDGSISPADAFKAIPNAEYAFKLSKGGTDFTPWSAYNSGAYKKYVPLVVARKVLLLWKAKVSRVDVELG
jgi:hypothetical protein